MTMTMQYEIGDKVVLRSDLEVGECYGLCDLVREMGDSMGQTVEILDIDEDGDFVIDDSECYYSIEMIDEEATRELNRLNGNQDSEVKLVPTKIYHLFEYYLKEENQNNRFMDTDNNCYRFCKMSGLIEILDGDRENWWDITSVLHSRDIMSTDIKPYEKAKRMTLQEIQEELGYLIEIAE